MKDAELLGNPIIGAIVAGGVSLAGVIVGGVAKKRQREAEAKAIKNQQAIDAAAIKAAEKKTAFNPALLMIAAVPAAFIIAKQLKKGKK